MTVCAGPARRPAEGIGTFALVFAGCGAVITDAETRRRRSARSGSASSSSSSCIASDRVAGTPSPERTSIRSVSLSFFLTRHLPARDLGTYVAAQLVGALLASLLLLVIWPGHPTDLGATVPSIASGRALAIEVVLTALLMLVIMSVATDTRAVGAACGARDRRRRRPRGDRLRAVDRRLVEHRPIARPGRGVRSVAGLLGLLVGPLLGAPLGALALPVRARRARAHADHGQLTARWQPCCSSACTTPGARR